MARTPRNKTITIPESEKQIDDQIIDLIKLRKLQQEALLKIKSSVEKTGPGVNTKKSV